MSEIKWPEKKEIHENGMAYDKGYEDGWNACRAEFMWVIAANKGQEGLDYNILTHTGDEHNIVTLDANDIKDLKAMAGNFYHDAHNNPKSKIFNRWAILLDNIISGKKFGKPVTFVSTCQVCSKCMGKGYNICHPDYMDKPAVVS